MTASSEPAVYSALTMLARIGSLDHRFPFNFPEKDASCDRICSQISTRLQMGGPDSPQRGIELTPGSIEISNRYGSGA